MKRILLAAVLAPLLLSSAIGAPAAAAPDEAGLTLYVAPGGDDAASGTIEAPLATLEGARDALRTVRADGGIPAGGAKVLLREGDYPRTESFHLEEADSGTAERPITYASYPSETARLTGGVELDRSAFVPVTDASVLDRIIDESARAHVLQVDLEALSITDYGELSRHGYWHANDVSTVPPMEFYLGGQGMTLARWPNDGTAQMNEIIDAGPTRHDDDLHDRGGIFSYAYDRPQHWVDADDIWLDGIFGYSWEWSYNKIEAIDPDAQTIELAYGEMSGLMKTWFEDFHFAENLLEELDAPGEYYIDRDSGVLYFMPNAAFRTTDAQATVTTLDEPMIRTDGTSHVAFDSLVLEYGRATAAVILGGSNVTISNSDIRNFADGGVLFNSPGRYTYDGIQVNRGGLDHAVLSSTLSHIGGVPVVLQGGNRETLEPGNIRVENSHIHDFAYYHKAYNPGVMFDGVGNIARNNEIHDAPHPGIVVYGNDHLIENNEIYDVCKTFQDLGAIYMNAGATPHERGTEIRGNYFHDTGIGRLGVEGVYADNLTMGLLIEQNYFYRMGNDAIKSGSGNWLTSRNNVFIDSHIPYNNYEMWMGDEDGNTVDTDYRPGWITLFEENNNFEGTPYLERYPELEGFLDQNHYYPEFNYFENNVTWNPNLARHDEVNEHGARDVHNLMNYSNNWVTDSDPGFVDFAGGDFTIREDAAIFDEIPEFETTPFNQIGTQGTIGAPTTPEQIALESVHLPDDGTIIPVGGSVSLAAEVIPWNATHPTVAYTSSDPTVATVGASGMVEALAVGEVTITATSTADSSITDSAVVTVAAGNGVLHVTDFESGANGWPIDGNRQIVPDDDGNHWYRIADGANGQLPRGFAEYILEFDLRTPEDLPEGAVMLIYDRMGPDPSGYVQYQHSEEGPRWTLYDGAWDTVEQVSGPAESAFTPQTTYQVRMSVTADGITVHVDGDQVLTGPNLSPGNVGQAGFYVEEFAYLDFDNVSFALPTVGPTDLVLSPSSFVMAPGETRRLTVGISPDDAAGAPLLWESDDPGVVSVESDGRVRAVAPGTARITVTSANDSSVSASATITVSSAQYPTIDLDEQLRDAEQWTATDAVDFDAGTLRISGEGVIGYSGETFGNGLLRFIADVDGFDGGWYGFAVRSDRTGDPTWVEENKGYLVVIKEDQLEFQAWRPGQNMMEIIPNTVIEPNGTYEIEFGTLSVEGGTRLVFRVDGATVWSGIDPLSDVSVADQGYFNVYHYAGEHSIMLSPVTTEDDRENGNEDGDDESGNGEGGDDERHPEPAPTEEPTPAPGDGPDAGPADEETESSPRGTNFGLPGTGSPVGPIAALALLAVALGAVVALISRRQAAT